jgi:hypothetical protein
LARRLAFMMRYNWKDIRRRKVLFCIAFMAVFISIFCTLVINVFVKKGSLIFVKMSEDLQIDAVIMPSMRKSSDIEEASTEPNNFRFNFTRIQELQNEEQTERTDGSPGSSQQPKRQHLLSPRITFKALNEIKGSQTGLYEKYGGLEKFKESFIPEIGLPRHEDVYGQMRQSWNLLRNIIFLKSQLEMDIGIGEEYKLNERADGVQKPIDFGVCQTKHGWLHEDEIEIFQIFFDYDQLAQKFNSIALENGWPTIANPHRLVQVPTRIACRGQSIDAFELDQKVTKHLPDQFILEYDTFFKLLSYYLPDGPLRNNLHFVNWLRDTPGLPDEFATELEYNLPKPRESHYQDDFNQMRRKITTYLQEVEEFLGNYPVMIISEILNKI